MEWDAAIGSGGLHFGFLVFCEWILGAPLGSPVGGLRSQLSGLRSQVSGVRSQFSGIYICIYIDII